MKETIQAQEFTQAHKKSLQSSVARPNPRGMVWWVGLKPGMGNEEMRNEEMGKLMKKMIK